MKRKGEGFTLIELLIVVAIIAILAAIAVPNFLEAQVRAKTSRVASDMRTTTTALETYRVDFSNYPSSLPGLTTDELRPLTTPISYLTSLPRDPFSPSKDDLGGTFDNPFYDYIRFRLELIEGVRTLLVAEPANRDQRSLYTMLSAGPDGLQQQNYLGANIPNFEFHLFRYDPTNGTLSLGDIYSWNP